MSTKARRYLSDDTEIVRRGLTKDEEESRDGERDCDSTVPMST